MRKLPPDSEVHALRDCGMSPKEIAERYDVGLSVVYQAIRKWEGRPAVAAEQARSPNADNSFTRKSAQPVEHRDTGESVGTAAPQVAHRVHHTTLKDCGDLLREWGIGRSFG